MNAPAAQLSTRCRADAEPASPTRDDDIATMTIAADRGGPFVRSEGPARNWMRAAAPGIAFRFPADESSPIGGGSRRARQTRARRRPRCASLSDTTSPATSIAIRHRLSHLYHIARGRGHRELRPWRLHLREGAVRAGAAAQRRGIARARPAARSSRGRGRTRIRSRASSSPRTMPTCSCWPARPGARSRSARDISTDPRSRAIRAMR